MAGTGGGDLSGAAVTACPVFENDNSADRAAIAFARICGGWGSGQRLAAPGAPSYLVAFAIQRGPVRLLQLGGALRRQASHLLTRRRHVLLQVRLLTTFTRQQHGRV